jgi:hypothetical protein
MDKVKAQATQIAQKSQEAAREGKARLDQAQANKQADAMLRNLGALVYAERTSRGTPDTDDKIASLVSKISAHEKENGINLAPHSATAPEAGVPPQASPADPGPSSGTAYPPEA